MSLFKPAWKSSNIEKALRAVQNCDNPEDLETIAMEAPSEEVCLAAVQKLKGGANLETVFKTIADKAPFVSVRLAAAKNLPDDNSRIEVIKEIVLQNNDREICLMAIKLIEQSKKSEKEVKERALGQIAEVKADTEIGKEALNRIKSTSIWVQAALKSKDPKLKLQAVGRLNNEADLCGIAMGSDTEDIRLAAVGRITRPEVLSRIAETQTDTAVGRKALSQIKDPSIWAQAALKSKDPELKLQAVGMLDNDADLCGIAMGSDTEDIRLAAVGRITRPEVLSRIAETQTDTAVGRKALSQIKDPSIWAQAALKSKDPELKLQAVGMLSNNADLYDIAMGSDTEEIRLAAVGRITKPELLYKTALDANSLNVRIEAMNCLAVPEYMRDTLYLEGALQKNLNSPEAESCFKKIMNSDYRDSLKKLAGKMKKEKEEEEYKDLIRTVLESKAAWKVKDRERAVAILAQRAQLERLMKDIGEKDEDPQRKLLMIIKGENRDAAKAALDALQKDLLYYQNLLDNARPSHWDYYSVETLQYFPRTETVTALIKGLNSSDQRLAYISAVTLKTLYNRTMDGSLRDEMKRIPQRKYFSHTDYGNEECNTHEDMPEVSFYL